MHNQMGTDVPDFNGSGPDHGGSIQGPVDYGHN
jgi:hypothetical protein